MKQLRENLHSLSISAIRYCEGTGSISCDADDSCSFSFVVENGLAETRKTPCDGRIYRLLLGDEYALINFSKYAKGCFVRQYFVRLSKTKMKGIISDLTFISNCPNYIDQHVMSISLCKTMESYCFVD